ncbi:MAG: transcriptional regulator [Phaeodactylibacter sp.]|nr:transcriptional regulator [Phaeodactylibacter sp.]
MKNIITNLNKSFDNRTRLGIMSVLMVNDWVEFKTLRDALGVTDGNLASHLGALEDLKYVQVRKRFVGKRPNTSYRTTVTGATAFQAHLSAIERLIPALSERTKP